MMTQKKMNNHSNNDRNVLPLLLGGTLISIGLLSDLGNRSAEEKETTDGDKSNSALISFNSVAEKILSKEALSDDEYKFYTENRGIIDKLIDEGVNYEESSRNNLYFDGNKKKIAIRNKSRVLIKGHLNLLFKTDFYQTDIGEDVNLINKAILRHEIPGFFVGSAVNMVTTVHSRVLVRYPILVSGTDFIYCNTRSSFISLSNPIRYRVVLENSKGVKVISSQMVVSPVIIEGIRVYHLECNASYACKGILFKQWFDVIKKKKRCKTIRQQVARLSYEISDFNKISFIIHNDLGLSRFDYQKGAISYV